MIYAQLVCAVVLREVELELVLSENERAASCSCYDSLLLSLLLVCACLCELPACLCSRYFHLLKLRFGWFGIIPMCSILLACQVDFAAAQPVMLI